MPVCPDCGPKRRAFSDNENTRGLLSVSGRTGGFIQMRARAGLEEVRMDWVSDAAVKRQFERFAAEASDSLLRTGYLMTGDVKDAEDLVQETLLRVARRWNRVRSMDHPAAYARRILINLVLDDAGRRVPAADGTGAARTPASTPPTRARRGRCGRLMTSPSSAGRWLSCLRGSVPCWCCATGLTCPSPRSRTSSAARPRRSPAPHPAPQPGWLRRSPAARCLPPDPPRRPS